MLPSASHSAPEVAGESAIVAARVQLNFVNDIGREGPKLLNQQMAEGRFEVELLRATTKPSERNVERRKGVLAWRATYGPGETRTIKFGYAVSYPDGQALPGF